MFNVIVMGDITNPQGLLKTLNTITDDKTGKKSVSVVNLSLKAIDKEIVSYEKIFTNKNKVMQNISSNSGFMLDYESLRYIKDFFKNHPVNLVEPESDGEGLPSLLNAAIEAEEFPFAFIVETGTLFPKFWFEDYYSFIQKQEGYKLKLSGLTGKLIDIRKGRLMCAGAGDVTSIFPNYSAFGGLDSASMYSARVRVKTLPKEFLIISREAWEKAGKFDTDYSVAFWDFAFSKRLRENNEAIFYEPSFKLMTYESGLSRVYCSLNGRTDCGHLPEYMVRYRKDWETYRTKEKLNG